MTELASGLTSTDSERLAQAESIVRAWCGWHIAPVRTDDVVVLDAMCSDLLVLPTLQLVALTSVVIDDVTIDATSYVWSPEGWVRRTGWQAWTVCPPARATITMTHGYETPPPAVTAVVQSLANRAISNPGSLISEQVGPFQNAYSQTGTNQAVSLALLDAEKQVLAPYVLPKRP